MKLNKLILFACLCLLSIAASAQNTEKTLQKPFQKWSEDEAMKIISSLPWSNQYQSTTGLAAAGQIAQAREQSDTLLGGRERGRSARYIQPPPVVIRLFSALPVRQAMARVQQIKNGYDKMNDEQRNKFDQSLKSFLDCAICQNYYVVTLTKLKDSSGSVDDGVFQTLKYEDLKGKIWLVNDKNERRELVQFTPPKGAGDSAVFFFKRADDKGNALLTTDSKDVKFLFANELLTGSNNAYGELIPSSFDFKVSKLIINNKVEF